jgi:hypothetical protein
MTPGGGIDALVGESSEAGRACAAAFLDASDLHRTRLTLAYASVPVNEENAKLSTMRRSDYGFRNGKNLKSKRS